MHTYRTVFSKYMLLSNVYSKGPSANRLPSADDMHVGHACGLHAQRLRIVHPTALLEALWYCGCAATVLERVGAYQADRRSYLVMDVSRSGRAADCPVLSNVALGLVIEVCTSPPPPRLKLCGLKELPRKAFR